jgi:hypothetical protein
MIRQSAEAVTDFHDEPVGRSEDFLAIAVIAVQVFCVACIAVSHVVKNQKIIGISLGVNIPRVRRLFVDSPVHDSPFAMKRKRIFNRTDICIFVRKLPVISN